MRKRDENCTIICISIELLLKVILFNSSGCTRLDQTKGINCSKVNSVPSVFKALLSVLLK